MAGTATPIFPQSLTNFTPVQILPADTTTLKTLVTPGANGCKVENIIVQSTDTSAKDLVLVVTKGGTDFPLATISIPANSGNTNALVSVSLFQHAMLAGLNNDAYGNKYLYLGSGSVLKAKVASTVTTAKAISLFPQGGDY